MRSSPSYSEWLHSPAKTGPFARIFAALVIVLQAVYIVLIPPLQSPDEINHFYRAYQISKGQFMPLHSDQRLGGEIPESFEGFISRFRHPAADPVWKVAPSDIWAAAKVKLHEQRTHFRDFPNTALYSPVSYLPQAITIFILRQFSPAMGVVYYGTKTIMVFFWLFCMLLVLRWIPVAVNSLTFFLLLPMQLYVANSLSADIITNCLCFLFISFVLKICFGKDGLTDRQLLFIFILAVLIAFAKIVYVLLVPAILIIPTRRFKSAKHRLILVSGIILIALCCAAIWSKVIDQHHIPYSDYNPAFRDKASLFAEANAPLQKENIKNDPLQLPSLLINSIVFNAPSFSRGLVAFFGAYMDTVLNEWYYYIAYAALLVLLLTGNPPEQLSWRKRLFFLIIITSTLGLLVLSLHLTWNGIGRDHIECLQGRYLVPLVPLILVICSAPRILTISPWLITVPVVIFLNISSYVRIYERYFAADPRWEPTVVTTDFEGSGNATIISTGSGNLFVLNHAETSTMFARSGRRSLALPPVSEKNCALTIPPLKEGDRLQMRVFVKGEGAEIALTADRKSGPEYFFYFGGITYTDEKEWGLIDLVLTMPAEKELKNMTISLRNGSGSTVYADDLQIRLWRKKTVPDKTVQ